VRRKRDSGMGAPSTIQQNRVRNETLMSSAHKKHFITFITTSGLFLASELSSLHVNK
jgi:hypothetical protein